MDINNIKSTIVTPKNMGEGATVAIIQPSNIRSYGSYVA
jgi:hypothetical protein